MIARIVLNINRLIDQLKESLYLLCSLTIFLGAVIFLPNSFKTIFHLDKLPQDWVTYASILFLLFSFITFVTIVRILYKKISSYFIVPSLRKSFLKLDNYQKQIIIEILLMEDKSINLDYTSGVARYLMERKFIYCPYQHGKFSLKTNSFHVKYIAQPWLITAFNEDPDFFLRHKVTK